MSVGSAEAVHGRIVLVALVALGVVVTVVASVARTDLQIVLYSAMYVGGVCTFWLGYWFVRARSEDRRRELLER